MQENKPALLKKPKKMISSKFHFEREDTESYLILIIAIDDKGPAFSHTFLSILNLGNFIQYNVLKNRVAHMLSQNVHQTMFQRQDAPMVSKHRIRSNYTMRSNEFHYENSMHRVLLSNKYVCSASQKCGVIFRLQCDQDTNHVYIGETKRTLATRF